MKNRKGCSYYMGSIYRGTKRPILSPKKFLTREDTEEDSFYVGFVKKSEVIHAKKKKLSTDCQFTQSAVTPFRERQETQLEDRKKREEELKLKNAVHLEDLVKISSLKVESPSEELRSATPKNALSLTSPKTPKSPTIARAKTVQDEVYLTSRQKQQILDSLGAKRENKPIFEHFPSQVFLSPSSKLKKLLGHKHFLTQKKKITENLNTSFSAFHRRLSVKSQKKTVLGTKKKNSLSVESKKMFNFDGTLENHKIELPKRPSTAGNAQKTTLRHSDIRSYTAIANKCIKMKSKRSSNQDLKIQPWGFYNESQLDSNLIDLSFSSIHDNFSIRPVPTSSDPTQRRVPSAEDNFESYQHQEIRTLGSQALFSWKGNFYYWKQLNIIFRGSQDFNVF